jgi:hypothetical protein
VNDYSDGLAGENAPNIDHIRRHYGDLGIYIDWDYPEYIQSTDTVLWRRND